MKTIEGNLACGDNKFAIIVSRFNEFIGQKLLEGAIDCLKRHDCKEDYFDVFKVPGAFEIPIIAGKIAKGNKYNAIICLGAVIKGETPHFDYVASAASEGILRTSLNYETPIAFGVLTTDNIDQAIQRAGSKSGNKGWDAALTAIEMANLVNKI